MKTFYVFILFQIIISAYSQNHLCSILEHDTTIIFNHLQTDYLDDYRVALDNERIWFYKYNASYMHANEFTLYCFYINETKVDSFIIKIPRLNSSLRKDYYDNYNLFTVYNDFILLGYDRYLLILKRNNNTFKIYKKLKLNIQLSPEFASFISENSIFLARNENYSLYPKIKSNTQITVYTLHPKKKVCTIQPFFPFIASTHCRYGGDFFSVNSDRTCISFHQRTNYHIDLFDTSLLLCESIHLTPDYWQQLPEKQIRLIDSSQQAYILISCVMPLLKKYSFLDHVYWLDSNTILTKYFNQDMCYYDVIKKQNNEWNILKSQLNVNVPNTNNEVITKKQYWIVKQHLDKVFIYKNKMICVSSIPAINPIGKTIDAYTADKTTYFKNQSACFSIAVFTLKYP